MKPIIVSQDSLYYALKYALSRRSRACVQISLDIMSNLANIGDKNLTRMIDELNKDIFPEETRDHWVNLREVLKQEKERRCAPWALTED